MRKWNWKWEGGRACCKNRIFSNSKKDYLSRIGILFDFIFDIEVSLSTLNNL